MVKILRNPNTSELIHAIEYNMYEGMKAGLNLEEIEFEERDEYIKINSGIPFPMLNGVIKTKIPSEIAEKTINKIVSFFEEKKMPFIWIVGPSSTPHNLGELLIKNGLISLQKSPGMAYNINKLGSKIESIPNLKIIEVENIEIMKLWIDVSLTVNEWPKELLFDFLFKHYSNACLGVDSPVKAFLAYYNGEPVAISCVFYCTGVAGIYYVNTLKIARNKGIGTAVSLAPLYQAKELGYEIAILQSSELGFNIYKKIGFKEYCNMEIFMWSPI